MLEKRFAESTIDVTFGVGFMQDVSPIEVAARFIMRGTHRGTFFGVPPTGKTIAVQAMNFYPSYLVRRSLLEALLSQCRLLTAARRPLAGVKLAFS